MITNSACLQQTENSSHNKTSYYEEELSLHMTEIQSINNGIPFISFQGHLMGVCGNVGSGKSSLINAILGRVRLFRKKFCQITPYTHMSLPELIRKTYFWYWIQANFGGIIFWSV